MANSLEEAERKQSVDGGQHSGWSGRESARSAGGQRAKLTRPEEAFKEAGQRERKNATGERRFRRPLAFRYPNAVHATPHESASTPEEITVELSAARIAAGIVLATLIAYGAHRAGTLSQSGGGAAIALGWAAIAAGWSWGALLLCYFVSAALLTRFRGAVKAARVSGLVTKSGPRDAAQVLANGGVFAAAALLWLSSGWEGWRALAAAALAASASDTWATELGTLAGRAPRSIVTWATVPTGTSGGISLPGTAAAVAGAAFIALTALSLGWPRETAVAAFAGGVAGSTIDSLLGATLQARRRCDRCNAPTELSIHTCGAPTRLTGGFAWLDNDAVNAVSTAAGGLCGMLLSA